MKLIKYQFEESQEIVRQLSGNTQAIGCTFSVSSQAVPEPYFEIEMESLIELRSLTTTWLALDWSGLDWAGLGWSGLVWAGLA